MRGTMARVGLLLVALGFAAVSRALAIGPETSDADFGQLDITIGATIWSRPMQLQIKSDGQAVYKIAGAEARGENIPAQPGAVLLHKLPSDHLARFAKLIKDTGYLTAAVDAKLVPPPDTAEITLTLTRSGEPRSVRGYQQMPGPYAPLMHAIVGLARQEYTVYQHDYVSGPTGRDAWRRIGEEVEAMHRDPPSKPAFDIDYERYWPIAERYLNDFHNQQAESLTVSLRLAGHLKKTSQLANMHRMAHDRSSKVRRELAWALLQIHDESSLPVLVEMMRTAGDWDVGAALIRWGDDAVAPIVELIAESTDATLDHRRHTRGEDMIRSYLAQWDHIDKPIDPRVVAAVRQALSNDPHDGRVRTEYHRKFLDAVAAK